MTSPLLTPEETHRNQLALFLGSFGSLLIACGTPAPLISFLGKDITMDIAYENHAYSILFLSALSLCFSLTRRSSWLLYTGLAVIVTLGLIAADLKGLLDLPGASFVSKGISIHWGAVSLALGIVLVLGVGIWRTIKR
jgi:hypothetical protein